MFERYIDRERQKKIAFLDFILIYLDDILIYKCHFFQFLKLDKTDSREEQRDRDRMRDRQTKKREIILILTDSLGLYSS